MLKNYLLITLRRFARQKTYTAINVVGLAIGMSTVILLGLYVRHELSYDRQHPFADRTYRVIRQTASEDGRVSAWPKTSGGLGPAMLESYPEVERMLRIYRWDAWVRSEDQVFEEIVCLADESVFDVFDVEMVLGERPTAPSTMAITRSVAERMFGSAEASLGKGVSLEGVFRDDYTVTGVIADLPANMTVYFSVLMLPDGVQNAGGYWHGWRQTGRTETFLRLRDPAMVDLVEDRMQGFLPAHFDKDFADRSRYFLQPLTEVHLYSQRDYAIQRNMFSMHGTAYGSIRQVNAAVMIGLFVLAIACVNFVNLSTARAAKRGREIGLRKVVGARRAQVIAQLLGEAVLIALASLAVAIAASQMLLPHFSQYVGRPLSLWDEGPVIVGGLVGLSVLVGLVAGAYPAISLSAFQPARVLKSSAGSGLSGRLRRALVVVQFGVSIGLVIASLTASAQMRYVRANLGFDIENVVVIPIFYVGNSIPVRGFSTGLKARYQDVKTRFEQHPSVVGAATSRFFPQDYSIQGDMTMAGVSGEHRMIVFPVDEDFFDVMGIPVVAGRTFPAEYGLTSDRSRRREGGDELFVLNETAARLFGEPSDALGCAMQWKGTARGQVVGVVKDFHVRTMHQRITPVAFTSEQSQMKFLWLKIRGDDLDGTIDHLEAAWASFLPNRPLQYSFLDDRLDWYYEVERKTERALEAFTMVAILVACMGLFGLASYSVEQRTREIGVRKALGATASSVVVLMSSEFLGLVALANLIAWPTAYWGLSGWLENFAYRIDLSLTVFLTAAFAALAIAGVAISTQASAAARTDPINALKEE